MSTPVLNALMDFAVALGKENLSISGAVIELPRRTWLWLCDELRFCRTGWRGHARGLTLATPNGDVRVCCKRGEPSEAAAPGGSATPDRSGDAAHRKTAGPGAVASGDSDDWANAHKPTTINYDDEGGTGTLDPSDR